MKVKHILSHHLPSYGHNIFVRSDDYAEIMDMVRDLVTSNDGEPPTLDGRDREFCSDLEWIAGDIACRFKELKSMATRQRRKFDEEI